MDTMEMAQVSILEISVLGPVYKERGLPLS